MTRKAKILRVLRHKREVYTSIPIHCQRIHQIVFIEIQPLFGYGTGETSLQQTDFIVIDIDIGEYILQNSSKHISCRKEFIDTIGVHSFDNCLFTFRAFTEYSL